MKTDEVQVRVYIDITPDDEVGNIAVVMIWNEMTESWVNSGIVINNSDPEAAFKFALEAAKKYGLWRA
jgi:hypothetical protein